MKMTRKEFLRFLFAMFLAAGAAAGLSKIAKQSIKPELRGYNYRTTAYNPADYTPEECTALDESAEDYEEYLLEEGYASAVS